MVIARKTRGEGDLYKQMCGSLKFVGGKGEGKGEGCGHDNKGDVKLLHLCLAC